MEAYNVTMSNLEKPIGIVQWTYEAFVEQEIRSFPKAARGVILHYATENKKIIEEGSHLKNKNEMLNDEIKELQSENLLLKEKLKFDIIYDLLKILLGTLLGYFLSSTISGTLSTNASRSILTALIVIFILLLYRYKQNREEKHKR